MPPLAGADRLRVWLPLLIAVAVPVSVIAGIDDFGTGFSSLAWLKKMPVDELKIDRTFVAGMRGNRDDQVIVRSTVELAHNLGLQVVAEGVDSGKALDTLRAYGCDLAQGFHISGPLRRSKFETWLRESAWGPASLIGESQAESQAESQTPG